ncbi:MFS general substrate transporter [Trichodelitschia bisporula]|uniref:MFS general substrate transporter n=1 Tax=Trichodelitschia bisporula TaxID=703511 RepID=A0A6G1HTL9_9PEZI|nr:MFS general substrate transporter [Trichodelitschia bisporula]
MHPQDPDLPSRGPAVLVVTAVMLVLSTLFVVLRLVSKFGIVRRVSLDDYFMILAWCIAFGLSFAICYGTSVGLGRHQAAIPDDWNSPLKKSEYAFSVLYNPALMATKTSILLFYLTLSKSEKIFRWATLVTLMVVNAAGLALTFLNIFQCRPVGAAFATPVLETDRCQDIVTLYLSSAPVNIITDLAILFLPMPILTGMRLPKKQKTILVITFGFGFFVAVVDVIRIAYLQEALTARLDMQSKDPELATDVRNKTDVAWYASLSYMWSAIEVNVGIMCACVPGLKPLVSRFMPRILRDPGNSSQRESEKVTTQDAQPGVPRALELPKRPVVATEADAERSDEEPVEEEPVDMIDFLTTPDMLARTRTGGSHIAPSRSSPQRFFDFVDISPRRKCIIGLSARECLLPNLCVTILFFIWGIAYGFLDAINLQFQRKVEMGTAQKLGIHSAYFSAYFAGTLSFGRLVFKRWGFKACFIIGLCIYACGVLIFWPSAVLTSFPAFVVSNFIVGLGLSSLEIAANPFVALCGPPRYMEARLQLAQAVQAIGSVVSPLLAQKVLFRAAEPHTASLVDVQWTYLGIALIVVLLAVLYYYIPLPEATDAELEAFSARSDDAHLARITLPGGYRTRVVFVTLALGVIAQFCYLGAQESVSVSGIAYLLGPRTQRGEKSDTGVIGHSVFTGGRFIAAALCTLVKPRYVLFASYAALLVLSILATRPRGPQTEVVLMLLYAAEGPIFSILYATSLRGLGRWTKDGSALLAAAISGGAVFPPITYAISSSSSPPAYERSYGVIVATVAVGCVFPLWTNFTTCPNYLAQPHTNITINYTPTAYPRPSPIYPQQASRFTTRKRNAPPTAQNQA